MTDQQNKNRQHREDSREGLVLGIMLTIVKVLTDKGVNNAAAALIATDIIKEISENFGGVNFYFPKKYSGRDAERASEIMAEFDGKNHLALATKYGLSSVWIYKLIKQENAKGPKKPNINRIASVLKARQERCENV